MYMYIYINVYIFHWKVVYIQIWRNLSINAYWWLYPNNTRLPTWYPGETHSNRIFYGLAQKISALQPGNKLENSCLFRSAILAESMPVCPCVKSSGFPLSCFDDIGASNWNRISALFGTGWFQRLVNSFHKASYIHKYFYISFPKIPP